MVVADDESVTGWFTLGTDMGTKLASRSCRKVVMASGIGNGKKLRAFECLILLLVESISSTAHVLVLT